VAIDDFHTNANDPSMSAMGRHAVYVCSWYIGDLRRAKIKAAYGS
jgi:hypothetical protein